MSRPVGAAIALGMLAMMVGGFALLALPDGGDGGRSAAVAGTDATVGVLGAPVYTAHNPIVINNDGGFHTSDGVTGGSGSEVDPWVISGWEIDGHGKDCIKVANTTEHFRVTGCRVFNASGYYKSGIATNNVTVGRIDNCTLETNDVGIYITNSTNVSAGYCAINSNTWGVQINQGSVGCLIEWMSLYNNYHSVAIFGNSMGITINYSTIYNSHDNGIWLSNSHSCIVSRNEIRTTTIYNGIALTDSNSNIVEWNTIQNVSANAVVINHGWNNVVSHNNLVGKNKTFSHSGVNVYYSGTNSNTIYNNTIQCWHIGIFIDNGPTWRNHIQANVIRYNFRGIVLNSTSTWNKLIYNTLQDNRDYAVWIESGSAWNFIHHNNFLGNRGGQTQGWDYQSTAGVKNYWNTSGSPHGFGNHWSGWTSPDANSDGIVDNVYGLDTPFGPDQSWGIKDNYPLVDMVTDTGPAIPEPQVGIFGGILVLVLTAVTLGRMGRKFPVKNR